VLVLLRGEVICKDNKLHGRKGQGQFLECGTPGPVANGHATAREPLWISA